MILPFSPNLVANHTPISLIPPPCYLDPPHTPLPIALVNQCHRATAPPRLYRLTFFWITLPIFTSIYEVLHLVCIPLLLPDIFWSHLTIAHQMLGFVYCTRAVGIELPLFLRLSNATNLWKWASLTIFLTISGNNVHLYNIWNNCQEVDAFVWYTVFFFFLFFTACGMFYCWWFWCMHYQTCDRSIIIGRFWIDSSLACYLIFIL